ncbi:MAG: hypothetical protein KGH54_00645 [Candidatus Micrarchaeota archaeon]|nr:hypothetical protein [Candidatus Micrarchaeota archaeon]
MNPATRVKPIPPGETILVRSEGNSKASKLKELARRPQDLPVFLEKEAEIIAAKFSMAQYKVLEVTSNAPVKLPDWAVHNQIKEFGRITTEKLVSHLTTAHSMKVSGEGPATINPEIATKLRKLFTRKVYPLIKAPPYFNGPGLTEDKINEIKSEALKILTENVRSTQG